MIHNPEKQTRDLLVATVRRLPAGQRLIQEAFTSDHRRPVWIKTMDAFPDTFYFFGDTTAHALADAVLDLASHNGGGSLTVSFPYAGELRAQQHRIARIAPKFESIDILTVGRTSSQRSIGSRIECHNIENSPLAQYRIALYESHSPILFICRETQALKSGSGIRNLGLFSFDEDVVAEMSEDIDQVLHGTTRRIEVFEKLLTLHRTTQRISRELESYSRRIEAVVKMARRRPDLLTPARFDRIVGGAIAKMEQLKKLPIETIAALDKKRRQ